MPNLSRLRFGLTTFCLGMIVVHAVLFWMVRRQIVSGSSDFRIFYTAGLMVRRGQAGALYSEKLQATIEREFALPAVQRGGPLPYNHPPFEAILYVPMTYLPYFAAYGVWFAVNMLLLAGSLYHVRAYLPTLACNFRGLLILSPLAFFPIAYALLQGQDSILLLALYVLAYVALRGGRDLQGGICLGLGLFKFHLVLPFAFMLLLRRRWRALAGMSLVAVVEALISWVLVGWDQLVYYPHFAWQVNQQQAPGVIVPSNMANLRGLMMGWKAMNPPSHLAEAALAVVSVGLAVWASRQWRASDRLHDRSWDSGFSVCLFVTYLIGYHGYNQDMSFLLLPLLLALDRALAEWPATGVGFKFVLGLMFLSPLYLFLTLQLSHQNLFAIVLLSFAGCLAASAAITQQRASADKGTGPSAALLQ
jgi:hypothetical protein